MRAVDASALAKYLLREEGWEKVEDLLLLGAYSLDLAVKEVANAIWKHHVLRGVISREQALEVYRALRRLAEEALILEPQSIYMDEAFSIAIGEGVTVYDALYIAQARARGGLLTADNRQAAVAERLGVKVVVV